MRADDVDAVGRIFHRVVEYVEDCGAQIFSDAADVQVNPDRHRREFDGVRRKVIAQQRDGDAVGDQRRKFDQHAALVAAGTEFAGFEHLLHGAEQAVGVGQHDLVELLALRFWYIAALQSLEIETDRGDGRLQFVRDSVEEGVLALVAADLADEEDGVQHDACYQHREKDDTEHDGGDTAFVQDDPGDVVGDQAADQEHPKGDGECDRSASSSHVHGVELSIVGGEGERWTGAI